MLTLDIEVEVKTNRLVCVGWALDNEPVESAPSLPDSVRKRLADPDEVVVTHSGYDVRYLHFTEGADINAQQHDTQVMAWLVNENTPLDLAYVAQRYLGLNLDKTLQKQAGLTPFADIASYCMKDVEVTRELYLKLTERLKLEQLWDYFENTEAPFTKVLRDMEFNGLPIDLQATEVLAKKHRAKRDSLRAELGQGLPSCFNPSSPQQVALLLGSGKFTLADRLPKSENELNRALDTLAGTPTTTDLATAPVGTFITEKSGRLWDHGKWVVQGLGTSSGFNTPLLSVSRQDLMDSARLMNIPWVVKYLAYKKLDKLLGTYLDVFPEVARSGRIYGRFNQTGTTTGRLSSSEPNLQNIPSRGQLGAEVRDLFRGNLVVGDFSQLEPRLMAHFSGDPYMRQAFITGRDLYDEIAKHVNCPREVAKTLVLAMSYGAGPQKVAQTLRLNGHPMTTGNAASLLARLQNHYVTYFAWREGVINLSKTMGYVQTIDGRLRRLNHTDTKNASVWKDPSAPGRQAANAVVQGSAADIVRRVMLHTTKMFPNLHLLAQVHDELVFGVDDATFGDPQLLIDLEKWVLQIAQRGVSVPLVFKPHYGTSWLQAKEGLWKP
jgi:DNA polymerase I-like protein with 3'-5' exonuclease and polymerase domains